MNSIAYRIRASIYRPTLDESTGDRSEDRIDACSVAIDIHDRIRKSTLESLLRECTSPGPPGWPAVLGDALDFVRGVCASLLMAGYLIRIDLPADQRAVEAPDGRLQRTEDLDDVFSKPSAARCDGLLYPVHLWGMEREKVKLAVRAIDSFRVVRFETNLANQIMSLGCFRLALMPESMDLSFACDKLDAMRYVLNAQAARLKVSLAWITDRE